MEILENCKGAANSEKDVILIISYKEAEVLSNAMDEYVKKNKRKKIAKRINNQFYKQLPY